MAAAFPAKGERDFQCTKWRPSSCGRWIAARPMLFAQLQSLAVELVLLELQPLHPQGIGARVQLTSSSSDRADVPDYFPSFSGSRAR
jgi:hypothetical protein